MVDLKRAEFICNQLNELFKDYGITIRAKIAYRDRKKETISLSVHHNSRVAKLIGNFKTDVYEFKFIYGFSVNGQQEAMYYAIADKVKELTLARFAR